MTEIVILTDLMQKRIDQYTARLSGAMGSPVGRGLLDCGFYVMRKAARKTPVDRGLLRASVIAAPPEADAGGQYHEVTVGTNVEYAPYQEFGTKPFWPPPGALAVWARRHKISEFLVRRAIATRGIKPKRYLRTAFSESQVYIGRRMRRAVKEALKK